jgi:transcriptional regulator with XRE-family HTH domain
VATYFGHYFHSTLSPASGVGYSAVVKFLEKLHRVSQGINKSEALRGVGLKPNTISTYLAKKNSLPRADIAFKISRALNVPVAWLLDDDQGWPPPSIEKPGIGSIGDDELVLELARRYRRLALRCLSIVEVLEKARWEEVARQIFALPFGAKLPAEVEKAREVLWFAATMLEFSKTTFDPKIQADLHHSEMPGSERAPGELDINSIEDRASKAVNSDPYAQIILTFFFPSPRTASITRQEYAEKNFMEGKRRIEQLSRDAQAGNVKPPPTQHAGTISGSVRSDAPTNSILTGKEAVLNSKIIAKYSIAGSSALSDAVSSPTKMPRRLAAKRK